MASKRVERVNGLLKREIATALYQLQFDPPLDLARVTVADVDCSPDLRNATVHISVLENGDTQSMDVIRTLLRHRKELQKEVFSKVVLKYSPHLRFELDTGQEKADRIYQILDALPPAEEITDGPQEP
jgi:ribosome-binding factor A